MKTRTKLISVILGLGLATAATSAKAQSNDGSWILSVAGVVNDQVDDFDRGDENKAVNVGGGLLVEANVGMFGLETGALYVNRQYDVERGNLRLVQDVKRIHVPVLLRYWIGDYFSIGAGPFVAFRTGNTDTRVEVGGTELASIQTSADDDVEFGLDAAAALNIAMNDKTGLFIEGRYSALLDQENDEEANELSGLAGFKFDI